MTSRKSATAVATSCYRLIEDNILSLEYDNCPPFMIRPPAPGLHLKHIDTWHIFILGSGVAGIAAVSHLLWPPYASTITLVAAVVTILGMQRDIYRRRHDDDEAAERHQQAVVYLHQALDLRNALPPYTGWSASPELCADLLDLITEHKPQTIVECGGGASSVVVGYALERNRNGRLISLDHMEDYAEVTRRRIGRHKLSDWVEIRVAPLTDITLEAGTRQWYDRAVLDDLSTIDMLIIDGPPEQTQSQARYPALPVLADRLSDTALVVLDDAYRDDEQAILDRWQAHNPEWTLEMRESPHGTAILHRNSA